MTLLRLIQRASILAGMTFASLSLHSNPAQAEITEFCIISNNGKTVCGKTRGIERMCVTTDGKNTICGKFKSVIEGQEQRQETSKPSQNIIARKEVDNFVYTLKGCRKSDTTVKCELGITNKGKERSNYISSDSSSFFVDTTGKSNQSSSSDIGGNTGYTTITPGIDYSASITFSNVSEQVVKVQLLNIGTNYSKVQFRNVSFTN
jgi:hypothetical protein